VGATQEQIYDGLDADLSWSEQQLPERERTKHVHRLHPYLGKYIPQLVEELFRRHVPARGRVLDPFAGSGTTLVQALESGLHSVAQRAVDVSNLKARHLYAACEKTFPGFANQAVLFLLGDGQVQRLIDGFRRRLQSFLGPLDLSRIQRRECLCDRFLAVGWCAFRQFEEGAPMGIISANPHTPAASRPPLLAT